MPCQSLVENAGKLIAENTNWTGMSAESIARKQLQNRLRSGLDIARYTACIIREDMCAYDLDPSKYTQSLGCWHGFIGQQKVNRSKSTSAPQSVAICTCRAG